MDSVRIIDEAKREWQLILAAEDSRDAARASAFDEALYARGSGGALLLGDNLPILASLLRRISAGEQSPATLVYMDPPYFSKKEYTARVKSGESFVRRPAFSDTWTGKTEDGENISAFDVYLKMLALRLIASRDLLTEDGSLWLHLDRRAAHYAKVLCDEIFGSPDCLINEVVWTYKSGGSSRRSFANKHDTLLYYAKNKRKHKFFPLEEKSYNRALKPYRFKNVKEYRDEIGWYTVVNMKDVWEIPMVGRTAGERTGYATQKPEALLERIVLSCTEEGDLCIDPFCGSGTLAAVCAKRHRPWICIDESPLAAEMAAKRNGIETSHSDMP